MLNRLKQLFARNSGKHYYLFIEDGGTFATGDTLTMRECRRLIKQLRKRYAADPGYYLTKNYEKIPPGKIRFTIIY